MSNGEIILYNTEDGTTSIQLKAINGTVWLSQKELAELFARDVTTINQHIRAIYEEGECVREATIGKFPIVQMEGNREVSREIEVYNLDIILAVGMRVRSQRGTQFRRWANSVLSEYLVKGFAMDDERLKDPKHDYFDELLQRIRDIRASEARFYHKVRDILSLSPDYDADSPVSRNFYATIQNKMLYAITSHTAAELIIERSDPNAPNMGLTSWSSRRVCKADVTTAKNYLGNQEIQELNQIVTMFLETAEFRAKRRSTIALQEWTGILDNFLSGNELPVLRGVGRRSKKQADDIAHQRYEAFDSSRKLADRQKMESEPDIDVSVALEDIEKTVRLTRKRRQD
ncbi:hydroxyacid dehydrogenase [Gluconobacter oxydans]|uniref:Virulence RhuM family protein n=1 Tax=Gluconobacter thailandicus TaxID=257438 RepID=A0AAP9JH38_GLUTH|nr:MULTISPECIES: virulence RhuM family protein [Gluconobacter]AFW00668.1 DNA-binding protein, putative [Gluconobacter oxydans H24]ANQ40635.1 hydroxyacid dehydrogenase [Gluconobacter oxydans]MCW2265330.1 hypothetical protein [Gluconobacter cerinus]QEH95823.1 virulence RhuM family protein [Gluconobacter thailandicus]